ncbi:nuclear transport factor 2 family protein [uncultured Roseobacter sp.]|uniref:nuclear transport factor 2 family protein n=1 Tax=uncultured Roseobacter sp. TaxID=114847 RepID=UPI002635BB75|nr:nuclear transport factor 2 family protein [uncultured Roseobacter sp.]
MFRSALLAATLFATSTAPLFAQSFPLETQLPAPLVDPALATPLSGADAIAVHEVVTRVYLAEDSRNAAALANLVTDDFVQDHTLYGQVVGDEEFSQWVLDNPTAFDRYRHVALNIVTRQVGPDAAEALSYVMVVEAHAANEEAAPALPRILAMGVVRDALVKEGGRWRIKHRIYDQFAVTAAVLEDPGLRLQASGAIASDSSQ